MTAGSGGRGERRVVCLAARAIDLTDSRRVVNDLPSRTRHVLRKRLQRN